MKRSILIISAVILSSVGDAQACGRRRSACGCRHYRMASQQRIVPAAPAVFYASPQASPQMVGAAPRAETGTALASQGPAPVQLASMGALPTYVYDPEPAGQPAYYYTYDSSGKLVVRQWMDWLFRGGRVAGMPAPPLPIIGALRGR